MLILIFAYKLGIDIIPFYNSHSPTTSTTTNNQRLQNATCFEILVDQFFNTNIKLHVVFMKNFYNNCEAKIK